MPKFKIANNLSSKDLGTCIYSPKDPSTTTIRLQKRILGDEVTLERILAHELIHHADFITNPTSRSKLLNQIDGGHGKFFKQYAAKINSVKGADFVTEKSDGSYIEEDNQTEFFILISPLNNNLGWSYTVRPSTKQREYIKRQLAEKSRLIKVKDRRFLTGPQIGLGKGRAIPRDPKFKELLERLYKEEPDAHI
jgi:hypothetical protein